MSISNTREIFRTVYATNAWGGEPGLFFSGHGSSDYFAEAFIHLVKRGIDCFSEEPTVVDLGCGDFRIGSKLVIEAINYVGVDVVPELIARNVGMFGDRSNVEFQCLDLVTDELPEGEIALLRQVMQHLSNDQILSILPKLEKYDLVFITEHFFPGEDFIPNLDKECSSGIRGASGVCLDLSPFNVKNVHHLLTQSHWNWGELRTFVIGDLDRFRME